MKVISAMLWAGVAGAMVMAGCGDSSTPGGSGGSGSGQTITILWAEWEPANALQKLANDYTKSTGVKVVIDKKPWSKISDTKQTEFNNNGTTYDIIIGDSQWVGQGVTGGHYMDLTGFIKDNAELFKDVSPAAMQFYAEYPKDSKKYYAVPCESDAMAFAYRKDLLEDPKHKDAFKKFAADNKAAGLELTVPKTWDHTLLIARYFKEASGVSNMAGFICPTTPGYDQAAMSFEPILWSFGGDWGDYAAGKVTIGSPESVDAMKFMKALVDTSSGTGKNADYGDVATAYTQGKTAMAMTYFAFFPAFASKKDNPDYFDKTGYFNVPAGPKGLRFTSLGGQGMSVNAHVDQARKDRSLAFIKWFSAKDTQEKWAQLGGFSANLTVLKSDAFRNAAPYNPLFEEAFGTMKDFWNTPQYDKLLEIAQENISAVLQGKKEPAAAIEDMQKRQAAVVGAK